MLKAISLGVFCFLAALHQGDHPIQKAMTFFRCHKNGNSLGSDDRRTCRYCAAIAAALADDRGQFARDGRLVDGSNSLDHFTVGGNDISESNREFYRLFSSLSPEL